MDNNSQHLLNAMEDYHTALGRQVATLRGELDQLQRSWGAFSAVYEGSAAEHFRAGWLRSVQMIEDYLATAERLKPVLGERLEALRETNRPAPELP